MTLCLCVFKNPQILNISNHHEEQKYFLNLQCRFVCTGTLLDYHLRFFVIPLFPLSSSLCNCLVFGSFRLFLLSIYTFTCIYLKALNNEHSHPFRSLFFLAPIFFIRPYPFHPSPIALTSAAFYPNVPFVST
jgi:hypothetical protein